MAVFSVSCIQQREFAAGDYLKSVMFVEQTCQNSLENCAEILLGLISWYAAWGPLAVEAGTLLMLSLGPDTSAVSTVPQRCLEEKSLCPDAGGATTEFCC